MLDADQTLRFPDFRAEERTFALVTQLAGRVGRGEIRPARAGCWCRRWRPTRESIAFAARHDSDGFLADELRRRKALGYPPFGSLIRIVCSAPDAAGGASRVAARAARSDRAAGATVLGPAPLFRLRGRSRSQLVIKAPTGRPRCSPSATAVDECAADAGAPRGERQRRRRPAVSRTASASLTASRFDALS